MDKNCSFKRLVGENCGKDQRIRKQEDLVPLLSCTKAISSHRAALGLTSCSGIDTEVELILARASIFSPPPGISIMLICPAHRLSLGIGWRRGSTRCRVPAKLSNHVGKTRSADRAITTDMSQFILHHTWTFLPVGSGK